MNIHESDLLSDIARIVCHRIRTHFAKLSIDQKRFLSVPTEASCQVITSTVRWGLLIAYSKSQITHEYPWNIFCWEAQTLSLSFNLSFLPSIIYISYTYLISCTYLVRKCNNFVYLSLLKHLSIIMMMIKNQLSKIMFISVKRERKRERKGIKFYFFLI